MIADILILGLGPIVRQQYDLGDGLGSALISAPSETGKSVGIIQATCFCLWGEDARGRAFPVEGIADDSDDAEVVIRLNSGTAIRRTMRKKNREYVRQLIGKEGTVQEFPREDAFQLALSTLGADHELLRTIMVPFAWVPLQERNARPLRDLLARVLPPMDLQEVITDLMASKGQRFVQGDPILEPEAVEARKVGNAVVDRAETQLKVAEEMAAEALAVPPSPPETSRESANAVLAIAREWGAYDNSEAAHARWVGWQERREALGPKPTVAAEEPTLSKVREQERLVADKIRILHELQARGAFPFQADLDALDERVADADAALAKLPTNTVCPTCGRRGWEEAKTKRDAAVLVLADANAKRDAEKPALLADREAYLLTVSTELARAHGEVGAAKTLLEGAQREWESTRTEDPTAAWEKAFKALGREPSDSRIPEPSRPRPDEDRIAAANAALNGWTDYAGAVREHERRGKLDADRLANARSMQARAKEEAARLEALVEAVRNAPSVIAKAQASVLGDLGPVKLRFGKEVAVEVLIDGRPWNFASTGKRILADVWLRNAIRRAADLTWLPLFVDETQSYSGDIPNFAPMICLRTSKHASVEITPPEAE
jgi:hypothetical protein